jgi:uncharacterized membrane protein HdeD (DUF308 family)
MSGRTILGITLIVLGLFALAYQGLTYTTQKKVVDIGPIQATKEERHTVPLSPILGALVLVGGIVVVISDRRGN